MSALPEEPGHFVAWRARQHPELLPEPGVFAPRLEWARYLDETAGAGLRRRRAASGCATCACAPPASGATAPASSSPPTTPRSHRGDAVVLATGRAATRHRLGPAALRDSAFFVPDPWAPGALDVVRRDAAGPADVLLVGTGLTMVDVVLSLTGPAQRPDRRVHAVSRHGELPTRHAAELQLAAIPEIDDWGHTLADYRRRRGRAPRPRPAGHRRLATGDGRPAHRRPGALAAARRERPRGVPPHRRRRLGPRCATGCRRSRRTWSPRSSGPRRSTRAAAEVADAEPLTGGGLRVTLSDGTVREVGWVVNCTGTSTVAARRASTRSSTTS